MARICAACREPLDRDRNPQDHDCPEDREPEAAPDDSGNEAA
jgi:hypothetical protein